MKLLTVVNIADYGRIVERSNPFRVITHPNLMSHVEVFIGTALTDDPNPDIEDFDVIYTVADWVDGQPLPDVAVTTDTDQLLGFVAGIARGLHTLHHHRSPDAPQGIVHRDVKPSNVRITPDGTPVLIDFGVARPLDDDDLTQGVGTYRWRAPEVLSGSAAISTAVDVWGLGAIAYWVLTGHPPDLDGAAAAREQLTHTAHCRHLTDPIGVAGHVATLLETNPAKRPADLARWASQLETILTARRRSTWRRPTAVAAFALLAIPGTALIATTSSGDGERPPSATTVSPHSSTPASTTPPQENSTPSVASTVPVTEPGVSTRATVVGEAAGSAGTDDLTLERFGSLAAPETTGLVVSPTSAMLATADVDGTIRMWDVASRVEVGSMESGATVAAMAMNGDGSVLASVGNDGNIRLWNTVSMSEIGVPIASGQVVTALEFNGAAEFVTRSPSVLASAGFDGTIKLWDPANGSPIGEPLVGHIGAVSSVSFDLEGIRLASAGDDGTIRLWDPATGQAIGPPLTGHTGGVTSIKFDLGATVLVSAGLDRTVRVWNPTTGGQIGEPTRVLQTEPASAGPPEVVIFVDPASVAQQRVAFATDGVLGLFDLASGDSLGSISPNGGILDFGVGYTDATDEASLFFATIDFENGIDLWGL